LKKNRYLIALPLSILTGLGIHLALQLIGLTGLWTIHAPILGGLSFFVYDKISTE
jgi:hypothetical protein